ncbi:8131_t:CDS:2 [Diversispora eburnea]|uniref:8131_t:CDS:1 n=1 Tax=Diversispora eburnea TaxID=1213867 RepID=A0A9N9CV56_9GLOM|nr:8131_t:CDS:2 [Diversispora eburnea]
MHSKLIFRSLDDPRFTTLKEIRNWFVYGSMIQPKRISQDMLEGFYGTIRESGGDSSTQTLKSYGHALNKYQVTALVSSEIKKMENWNFHLEVYLDNYRCSGVWYQDFLEATHLNDPYLISGDNINLELAEASKFVYIVGWIIYKLIKSNTMKSHLKFKAMSAYLKVLSSIQTTLIIPVLLCNLSLLENFNTLIDISNQMLITNNSKNTEEYEIMEENKRFLYEKIIFTYMKSRQKS